MKLIIDIPEETYEYWKEHKYEYVLAEAIANGIPITEGDLIMFRTLMTEIANKGLPFEEVLLLIDNAPTVEERPQGEWIIVKDEKWGDNVKCPFCGKELAGTDLNFCCKCGADMRTKENLNG